MVRLAKQLTSTNINVSIFVSFHKTMDTINFRTNVNPSLALNPGKCIIHFKGLRTRLANLHLGNGFSRGKGGEYSIQFMFKKIVVFNNVIFIWFRKVKGIVNSVINSNPDLALNPGKCIVHFQKLRTACMYLDPQIERRSYENNPYFNICIN